jgi:hypothetical protein
MIDLRERTAHFTISTSSNESIASPRELSFIFNLNIIIIISSENSTVEINNRCENSERCERIIFKFFLIFHWLLKSFRLRRPRNQQLRQKMMNRKRDQILQ